MVPGWWAEDVLHQWMRQTAEWMKRNPGQLEAGSPQKRKRFPKVPDTPSKRPRETMTPLQLSAPRVDGVEGQVALVPVKEPVEKSLLQADESQDGKDGDRKDDDLDFALSDKAIVDVKPNGSEDSNLCSVS